MLKNVFRKPGPKAALYRHGDVIVQAVDSIPEDAREARHLVLAEGELTGHAHRITEKDAATVYEPDFRGEQRVLFLHVTAESATLTHEEHGPIRLPSGRYRVWRQREYSPKQILRVRD